MLPPHSNHKHHHRSSGGGLSGYSFVTKVLLIIVLVLLLTVITLLAVMYRRGSDLMARAGYGTVGDDHHHHEEEELKYRGRNGGDDDGGGVQHHHHHHNKNNIDFGGEKMKEATVERLVGEEEKKVKGHIKGGDDLNHHEKDHDDKDHDDGHPALSHLLNENKNKKRTLYGEDDASEKEKKNKKVEEAVGDEDENNSNLDLGAIEFDEESSDVDEAIISFARKRAYRGSLMLIPVNEGYLDFGLNLMCSLLHRIPAGREYHRWDRKPTQNKKKGNADDDDETGEEHGDGDQQERKKDGGGHNQQQQQHLLDWADPARKGFAFVAMDKPAYDSLRKAKLPVFRDPKIPFVSSKAAQWADPKFHSLVCTKLIPVIRLLESGLNVILSDADITFLKDPSPWFRRDVSMTFSIGSCHRELADNTNVDGGNDKGKLNTGFYFAQPTPGVINLFKRALKGCSSASLTGDQPAINAVLQEDRRGSKFLNPKAMEIKGGGKKAKGDQEQAEDYGNREDDDGDNEQQEDEKGNPHVGKKSRKIVGTDPLGREVTSLGSDYSYGFLDGCLFANGCVYFKHLCAKATYPPLPLSSSSSTNHRTPFDAPQNRSDAVMVHANFLVGKKEKIKHLLRYDLWDNKCIGKYRVAAELPEIADSTVAVMKDIAEKEAAKKLKQQRLQQQKKD